MIRELIKEAGESGGSRMTPRLRARREGVEGVTLTLLIASEMMPYLFRIDFSDAYVEKVV